MSALGATFARSLGGLGGPGMAAALVAGGIVVGAIGGGIVASGSTSQPASATGKLAVYACPGTGAPIATVKAGQKLLATGRTDDSSWLRIHFPDPARSEAWVQAAPLQVPGSVASLPVATCQPELAIGAPSLGPGESLTAEQDNSPSPPPIAQATPTPGPTATPNARPSITALTASTRTVSYDTGGYCPTAVKNVTFTVKASDSSGLAGVTLYWRAPGASGYTTVAMSRTAGSAKSGTWQVSLSTFSGGITKAGSLAYYAVAKDVFGAVRRIPSGADTISVAVCVNTGPDITALRSSSGSTVSWDPLGAGRCQTATNLTAAVKDPQGVKSVTLFYRRPGAASWSSKSMNNQTIPGRWYANLDTLGDRIAITSPPTDTLRWYVRAVDTKNAASQSKTFGITVHRCDTEATFGQSSYSPSPMCPSRPTTFFGSASDPDGINGSSAVLVYTYRRADGSMRTAQVRMTGNNDGAWYYHVSLQPDSGWSQMRDTMTFYILTTDRYGGTSKGGSSKITVTNC
jgi:hypothetical protein